MIWYSANVVASEYVVLVNTTLNSICCCVVGCFFFGIHIIIVVVEYSTKYCRLCSGSGRSLVVISRRSQVLFNSHHVDQSLNTHAPSPIEELPAWSGLFVAALICVVNPLFCSPQITSWCLFTSAADTLLPDLATGRHFNLLHFLKDHFVVVVSLVSYYAPR